MSLEKRSKYAQKSPVYRFALKLLSQQVAFGLISFLFVTLFLSFFSEETAMAGTIIGSAIGFLLSLSAFFVSSWTVGDKDRNLVNYGHISYRKYKSLLAALLSLIPAALLCVPTILWEADMIQTIWPSVIYKVLFAPYLWLFLPFADKMPLVYAAPALAIPPICVWGYHNGYRIIYLMPKVMFRKKRS